MPGRGAPSPHSSLAAKMNSRSSARGARTGILLTHSVHLSDSKGATEDEVQKIDVIRGAEVLGYEGAGREEHSGENAPRESNDLRGELADNTKKDIEGR